MEEEKLNGIFDKLNAECAKGIAHLKNEFSVIRAGRANPHILDKVVIDYYGAPTPLNQMSSISVQDARMLVINLYDMSQYQNVRRALSEANLGVNIADDGKVIRLTFPALTEERRKEIAKSLKTLVENTKVGMRNARRDAIDALKAMKKDGALSEDEESAQEKEVQKVLDKNTAEVDNLYLAKEKEVMEV